jgi:Co/Zn/Cd efflux system component
MRKNAVRKIVLSTSADFYTGMSTAWAFAAVDSFTHLAWLDLISSLFLATLTFSAAISIKMKNYVEYS